MKIENIFIEFMSLYYQNSGIKPSSLKDISIQSGVIARLTKIGCTIYYLTTGNYIRIPWEFIDLFSSLNTYSGNRILSIEPKNYVEKFIHLFIKFINLLNNQEGYTLVPVLSEIVSIKTNTFREWYKNKFNKNLEPIEFFSPDKNFEI